ncbi:hypothetical protein G7K_2381-t1 [Saitoella complicata NRRL Y-17804]|uniref:Thioredoxin domain-containing protein n=1 Tax=Saitoella complicata (strain BCRC 22490 / CBS 7301 / JCM 7358 / NBRC 10748 / NRRL Y-17804) TaxID=698492 RepID=A0A0E9NER7_SAICN|nr:hypothetical protein G7K_2381-t1 [Saitoella complicata NRRL Y-17804]
MAPFRAAFTPVRSALVRSFHSTPAAFIAKGDSIPSVPLQESSPADKISVADLVSKVKKAVIVGVPAAFSPSCSSSHIPSYLKAGEEAKKKGIEEVIVVSVNDVFVMKAWKENLTSASDKIRFLADPQGKFTGEIDMLFDASGLLGNQRSKRYALVVEDGKVSSIHLEEDPTQVTVSGADKGEFFNLR